MGSRDGGGRTAPKKLRAFLALVVLGAFSFSAASSIVGCETEKTEATAAPEAGSVNVDGTSPPPTSGDGGTDSGSPSDGSFDAPSSDAGKLVCANDVDCKGGKCFQGVCICDLFLRIQPDGTCGQTPEPACLDQVDAGARCNSPQPVCKEVDAGEIPGSPEANRTCGDFAPAVCCFSGCRGPSFLCCGANGPTPQICVQGWRTCRPNERAALAASSCN